MKTNVELKKYLFEQLTPREQEFTREMSKTFNVSRVLLGRASTNEIIIWSFPSNDSPVKIFSKSVFIIGIPILI